MSSVLHPKEKERIVGFLGFLFLFSDRLALNIQHSSLPQLPKCQEARQGPQCLAHPGCCIWFFGLLVFFIFSPCSAGDELHACTCQASAWATARGPFVPFSHCTMLRICFGLLHSFWDRVSLQRGWSTNSQSSCLRLTIPGVLYLKVFVARRLERRLRA